MAIGVDGGRLALLLAVLEGAGLSLSSREVFVSCAGGLEMAEPAADLAVVAALVSSARGRPLPVDVSSSARSGFSARSGACPAAGSRLKEAAAMGFATVYLPAGDAAEAARFPDMTVRPVDRVAELPENDRVDCATRADRLDSSVRLSFQGDGHPHGRRPEEIGRVGSDAA